MNAGAKNNYRIYGLSIFALDSSIQSEKTWKQGESLRLE